MPVNVVVQWRRPGFVETTYSIRRHRLAEFLTSLGMTTGVDFPAYVPPERSGGRGRASSACDEEPASDAVAIKEEATTEPEEEEEEAKAEWRGKIPAWRSEPGGAQLKRRKT